MAAAARHLREAVASTSMSRPTCDTVIVHAARPNVDRSRTPPAGPAMTFSPRPRTRRHDVMKWRAYLWGGRRREVSGWGGTGGAGREGKGKGKGGRRRGGDRALRTRRGGSPRRRREQPLELSSFRLRARRQITRNSRNGVCRKKSTAISARPSLLLQRGGQQHQLEVVDPCPVTPLQELAHHRGEARVHLLVRLESCETTVPSPPRPPLWRSGIELWSKGQSTEVAYPSRSSR